MIQTTSSTRPTGHRWNHSLDFLWLEITPKCNLNCVHCYADSTPFNPLESKMHFDDWMKVLQDAYAIGCRQMQFIGGEPTIHPDLLCMIEQTKRMGYSFIEVFTNGISISDTMFASFVENDVHLAFSVYSYSAPIHDMITKRVGSFEKTIRSIKKSLSLGLSVRVGIVAMEENKNDSEKTRTFLEQIGVKNIAIDRLRGVGRGNKNATQIDPMNELCGSCWKGRLTVNSDGNIFPCVFSRSHLLGSVEESLATVVQKQSLRLFRENVYQAFSSRIVASCDPNDCGPGSECTPNGDCGPSN